MLLAISLEPHHKTLDHKSGVVEFSGRRDLHENLNPLCTKNPPQAINYAVCFWFWLGFACVETTLSYRVKCLGVYFIYPYSLPLQGFPSILLILKLEQNKKIKKLSSNFKQTSTPCNVIRDFQYAYVLKWQP